MADDANFKIKIGTEADVSGLDDVTKGTEHLIDASGEATEAYEESTQAYEEMLERQRKADVERAEAMKKGREQAEETKRNLDDLYNQQRLQGIGRQLQGLAAEAGRFAQEFAKTDQGKQALSGLSEELKVFGDTFTSIASGVATGFAEGGIVGGVIGGLSGLVKKLGGEWIDANQRIATSNAELEVALAASQQRLTERKQAAADDAIRQKYEAETLELQRQREELERIKALRGEISNLDAAKDKLADAKAINAGANPQAVRIENIGEGLERDLQALRSRIDDSRKEINLLSEEVTGNIDRYKEKVREKGTIIADKSEEFKTMTESMKRLDKADLDLKALEEQLAVRSEALTVGAQTALESETGKVLSAFTSAAQKMSAEIQANIDENSAGVSTTAKQGLAKLKTILTDGMVTPNEVQDLLNVVESLRATQEGRDAKIIEQMNKIIENGNLVNGVLDDVGKTLSVHAREIQDSASLIRTVRAQLGARTIPGN